MSRKKRQGIFWGIALKQIRNAAGLKQADIAKILYEGDPQYGKGNVSLIERNKIAITEDKIRLWVKACGKTMSDFYLYANSLEASELLKKSI